MTQIGANHCVGWMAHENQHLLSRPAVAITPELMAQLSIELTPIDSLYESLSCTHHAAISQHRKKNLLSVVAIGRNAAHVQ